MSFISYMTVSGKTQKLISEGASSLKSIGNYHQKGREDQIMVRSYHHDVYRPEGAHIDGRMHRPFVVTKMRDSSTPLLFNAWRTGEVLTCQLDEYRISPHGFQEHHLTTKLKDAIITAIDVTSPDPLDAAGGHAIPIETVSFAYRTILLSHEVCRTEGSDYWDNGTL